MKTIAQQLNIKDFPFIIADKQGNEIYYEVDGFWSKKEYDSDGIAIYCENSKGLIRDNRPKEDTESTLRIREFFRQVRLKTHHHLGLGAIKLTLEDQEELCELVEALINKTIEQ